MYIPNIPGISTSVIDRSTIKKEINNNRTILLPGFFKYGKEGFQLSRGGEFRERVGDMNLQKYGNAFIFGDYAANQNQVLHYRLLPSDATFANNIIDYNGNYTTKENITTKDQIFITLDEEGNVVENTSLLSALAKNRGEGYNSIFMTFSPATEFEKLYANKDGEVQYKFNFVQAEVYEETVNGVKSLSDPIVFSLMELDEITGLPIVDKSTGKSLYINHVFKDTNDYATLMLNDDKYRTEVRKYQNIDSLIEQKKEDSDNLFTGLDGRFIVKDLNDDRFYEIYVETYYEMIPNNLGVNVRTKKTRLASKVTTRLPRSDFYPFLRYFVETDAEAGTNHYVQVIVDDNVISYDFAVADKVATLNENGALVANELAILYFIDGEDALYTMYVGNETDPVTGDEYKSVTFNEYVGSGTTTYTTPVDTETGEGGEEITKTNIDFLRYSLYKQLITYSMKLYSGTDGANLYDSSGKLNMYDHPGDMFSQNARELLLDFYNKNKEIREVLYPKYDFDYIPDWTDDGRIQSAIILLADDIGTTMPLLSMPLDYNPKIITRDLINKDIKMRKDGMFWSTYNAMLYSGQMNKEHILPSGQKIYLSNTFYAMIAHLKIDGQYSITEPVANIVKGVIDTEVLNLTYSPDSIEIEQLRNVQVNTIIEEPDGTYFIDQLTMYKKASKLSRANIVKAIHRIRKDLPKLLKDLIQKKATSNITSTATSRAEKYMTKWKVNADDNPDGIFETISVNGVYNKETYKLRLAITVNPIGTIESIDIPIIVI